SKSAFNALLKSLEEPPEHVIFIMATTDAYKVPITITSRSQVFTFKLADPATMFKHLKEICKKEKIKITDGALEIVVRRGGGSFRDSLSLLDQVSTLSDEEITEELLEKALGLPQNDTIAQILEAYSSSNTDTIRALLTKLADTGIKPETIASEMIAQIIDRPDGILLPLLDKLTEVSHSPYPAAKLLVALCQNSAPVSPRQAVPAPKVQVAAASKPEPAPKSIDTVVEPAPAPKPAVAPVSSDAGASEIWLAVIKNVSAKAPLDVPIINEVDYVLKDGTLTIYAKKKFTKIRLEKKRNLISEVLPDTITLEITDEVLAKDPEMAKIADIMGGGEEIEIDA
ncbi:hypothetical protein J6X09_02305, partial [Candidatus Saccharibacteria bacterium]|nr:hypothetical protein [Candidatus Saccharibacteria bacterium]